MPTWVFSGMLLPQGEAGELQIGDGPREQLPGRYAIVGLVDAHCHLTVDVDEDGPYLGDESLAAKRLRACAQSGVAVVRDVGGAGQVTVPLGLQLSPGQPRVFAAGRFFAPPNHYFPRMFLPVEADQLIEAVAAQLAAGSSWLKLIGDFSPMGPDGQALGESETTYPAELVAQVIELAHRHSVRVAVHTNTEAVGWMVRAGVDSVEHGLGLTAGDLLELGRRGGAWTPTLCAVLGTGPPESRDAAAQARSRTMAELLSIANSAGVRVLAGSDVVGSVHREVALLAEHGLTPTEAISAASTDAYDFLGAPLNAGDLVTYASDPRDDAFELAAPAAVIVRGLRVR